MNVAKQQKILERTKLFKLMLSGIDLLPVQLSNDWLKATGKKIIQTYTITECGVVMANPNSKIDDSKILFRALNNVDVKLKEKELFIKSPGMLKDFSINKSSPSLFDENGYFPTGDLFDQHNETKNYEFIKRKNQCAIKVAGFKVYPLEIENIVKKYALIKDVYVLGVPDYAMGEIVGAIIISKQRFQIDEFQT